MDKVSYSMIQPAAADEAQTQDPTIQVRCSIYCQSHVAARTGPDKYFFRPLAHGKGILKFHLPWLILDKWPREKPLAQGQKSLVPGVGQVDLSYTVVLNETCIYNYNCIQPPNLMNTDCSPICQGHVYGITVLLGLSKLDTRET